MIIKELSFYSYRNLKDCTIHPSQETNIFFGDNAQGKTNLIELIWILTGEKSFRPAKEKELVQIGSDFFRIKMKVNSKNREQAVVMKYNEKTGKKVFLLNDIDVTPSRINEIFSAVVFAPEHLEIVKKGPEHRRKFIDSALRQLKPGCRTLINNYKRAVFQRNNILKNSAQFNDISDMLDVFEESIAKYGAELTYQRNEYCKNLQTNTQYFFDGLSDLKEKIRLEYSGNVFGSKEEAYESFLKELKENRQTDFKLGITSVGPHRHDIDIFINDLSIKTYGSQGQQRSCALAMKLSEALIYETITGNRPVALLDDVMSELDEKRRDYLINKLDARQVFITTCDIDSIMAQSKNSKLYNIKNGEIFNVSSNI